MKARRLLTSALVAGLILGLGHWQWSRHRRAERALAAIPARPAGGSGGEELARRLSAAEQALRADPHTLEPLRELARLYQANEYSYEALRCLEALTELAPKEALWPHLIASTLAASGRQLESIPWRERTIAADPAYLPAQLALADSFAKCNQTTKANETFATVLAADPVNADALLGLGADAVARENWTDARNLLERAVAVRPGFAPALNLLVTVETKLGDPSRLIVAQNNARKAKRYAGIPDPWSASLMTDCYDVYRLQLAASALANAGDVAQAELLLRRAIALAPQDGAARRQIGELLLNAGRLDEAEKQLLEGTHLAPNLPDSWVGLALLYERQSRFDTMDAIVAAGIDRNPTAFGLRLLRARRASQLGHFNEAIGDYRLAAALQPDDANASLELAKLLFAQQRIDEGMAALRLALRAEPDHPLALFLVTRHAIETSDLAAATDGLRRALLQPRINAEDLHTLRAAYRRAFPNAGLP